MLPLFLTFNHCALANPHSTRYSGQRKRDWRIAATAPCDLEKLELLHLKTNLSTHKPKN